MRGINYNYNNGNIYSGITDINGIYNSWLEYLRDGNENNITSEINKKLYERLIKDGKDNASNVKILGFIVGVLEAYVILFAILFFFNQPAFNLEIMNESSMAPKIVNSSPGLSNIVGDMNDAINEIYDITKSYNQNQNKNVFNRRVVNSLLKHDVIDQDYLNKLRAKGKINY